MDEVGREHVSKDRSVYLPNVRSLWLLSNGSCVLSQQHDLPSNPFRRPPPEIYPDLKPSLFNR